MCPFQHAPSSCTLPHPTSGEARLPELPLQVLTGRRVCLPTPSHFRLLPSTCARVAKTPAPSGPRCRALESCAAGPEALPTGSASSARPLASRPCPSTGRISGLSLLPCQGGEAVSLTQSFIGCRVTGRGGAAMTEEEIKVKADSGWKGLASGRMCCEPVLHAKLNLERAGNQEARLHRIWRNVKLAILGRFRSPIVFRQIRLVVLPFFFFFPSRTRGVGKCSGQGFIPSQSCDLRHSCSKERSLTHCSGLGIQLAPLQRQVGSLTSCATAGTPDDRLKLKLREGKGLAQGHLAHKQKLKRRATGGII